MDKRKVFVPGVLTLTGLLLAGSTSALAQEPDTVSNASTNQSIETHTATLADKTVDLYNIPANLRKPDIAPKTHEQIVKEKAEEAKRIADQKKAEEKRIADQKAYDEAKKAKEKFEHDKKVAEDQKKAEEAKKAREAVESQKVVATKEATTSDNANNTVSSDVTSESDNTESTKAEKVSYSINNNNGVPATASNNASRSNNNGNVPSSKNDNNNQVQSVVSANGEKSVKHPELAWAGHAGNNSDVNVGSAKSGLAYDAAKGKAIADKALSQIGVHQDCTALATKSLSAVGINFYGWPMSYASLGDVVPANEAKPGDIIVYKTNGMGGSHVAIYIGNGKAVHGGWNGNDTQIFSANLPTASAPIFIRVA